MKLLKRMAVLALVVLVLGGCTKSSIDEDPNGEPVGEEEVDPDKINLDDDDDETLPRSENKLVEEDVEPQPMYDWDQVKDESDGLFMDNDAYPQSVNMQFAADEDKLTIDLTWILKNGTSEEEAKEYAALLVKNFNDIVAVQSLELEESTDTSFGTLWDQFALNLKVGTEDGKWIVEKSYKAGDKIDLEIPQSNDQGPEDVPEENVPKKI